MAFNIVPSRYKSVSIIVENCEVLHLKLANIRNDARASRSPAGRPASGLASLIYREQSHYHITNIMRSNLRMDLKRFLDSFVVQNL